MKFISKITLFLIFIALISLNCVNAAENSTELIRTDNNSLKVNYNDISASPENAIKNADDNSHISINPGTYAIHNVQIEKNITIKGNGNPREIIIDGENKSSIFLIKNPDVHVTFENLTFINGLSLNFGGAISIETGHVTVNNCIFINNTALNNTNAGGISNYGTKENRGYLLVNNSLFINNHADHDGGAITTCYANSYIYNCVFINNSAHRDGGAIRVSVYGKGFVEDCIFMFNHADEWGGAYYSWSGESDVKRCIFMNNTAGTNGGAVMVSGNINLQESIIVNNNGNETGGSFYIQQPMYNTKTVINVHDNLITNNSSPYGKEIFIKWKDAYNLHTQFNNNDWGDENPNDSEIIDPNNVTPRSKVTKTIKSNLFEKLNIDLLDKYSDLLQDYFTQDSLDNLKKKFPKTGENETENNKNSYDKNVGNTSKQGNTVNNYSKNNNSNIKTKIKSYNMTSIVNEFTFGNSTSFGENKKAFELNEHKTTAKEISFDLKQIAIPIIAVMLIVIGYERNKKESK